MAMANSMTALLDKLKEDLHMQMIYRHLPDEIKMPEWEQRRECKIKCVSYR